MDNNAVPAMNLITGLGAVPRRGSFTKKTSIDLKAVNADQSEAELQITSQNRHVSSVPDENIVNQVAAYISSSMSAYVFDSRFGFGVSMKSAKVTF